MVTIAASTRLCAQVPSDWVGEGSTVSPNTILYLVGWLPKEIHFIRCRSVCMCLSVHSHSRDFRLQWVPVQHV